MAKSKLMRVCAHTLGTANMVAEQLGGIVIAIGEYENTFGIWPMYWVIIDESKINDAVELIGYRIVEELV